MVDRLQVRFDDDARAAGVVVSAHGSPSDLKLAPLSLIVASALSRSRVLPSCWGGRIDHTLTKAELLERLSTNPRFKAASIAGTAAVIVGVKPNAKAVKRKVGHLWNPALT